MVKETGKEEEPGERGGNYANVYDGPKSTQEQELHPRTEYRT